MDGRIAAMFVFAVAFLAVFLGFWALVPPDFVLAASAHGMNVPVIPSTWNGINIKAYNFTDAFILNFTGGISYSQQFEMGNRYMSIAYDHSNTTLWGQITIWHRYGLFRAWTEACDWYDESSVEVSYPSSFGGVGWSATIDTDILDDINAAYGDMTFTVKCAGLGYGSSAFNFRTFLYHDATLFPSTGAAWKNSTAAIGRFSIFCGITIDQSATMMNAWELVQNLLFFNTLEVFGVSSPEAVALNAIIAAPFYASIIIIAFAVLVELIPF